jgi:hypothetical protein
MSYKPQQYPKYLYHATEPARIVNNYEEHEALGEGWSEEPHQLPLVAEEPKQASSVEALDPKPKKKRK